MAFALRRSLSHLQFRHFSKRALNTLGTALDSKALEFEHKDALYTPGQDNSRFTMGEMKRHVNNVASGLWAMKFRPGDTIALWLPNTAENVICTIAASKLGLTVVSLDHNDGTFSPMIKKSGARGLIFEPTLGDDDRIATVQAAVPELDNLEMGLNLHSKNLPDLKAVIQTGFKWFNGIDNLELIQWEWADAVPDPLAQVAPELRDDSPALRVGDSTVSNAQLAERGAALAKSLGLSFADKVLLTSAGGPLTVATVTSACLQSGAELVIAAADWDAASAASSMELEGVTVLLAASDADAAALAAAGVAQPSSLRAGAVDGASAVTVGALKLEPISLN